MPDLTVASTLSDNCSGNGQKSTPCCFYSELIQLANNCYIFVTAEACYIKSIYSTFVFQKTLEDTWSIMMVASEQAQLMANLLKLINASKTIEIGNWSKYYFLMCFRPPDGITFNSCFSIL